MYQRTVKNLINKSQYCMVCEQVASALEFVHVINEKRDHFLSWENTFLKASCGDISWLAFKRILNFVTVFKAFWKIRVLGGHTELFQVTTGCLIREGRAFQNWKWTNPLPLGALPEKVSWRIHGVSPGRQQKETYARRKLFLEAVLWNCIF